MTTTDGTRPASTDPDLGRLADFVSRERATPLDWRDKAVQPDWYGSSAADVAAAAPSLDGAGTPLMTLDRAALESNITAMQEWCDAAGVSIAPHGKTTMSPALWHAQLAQGAWAICVANEPQLRLAVGSGVRRVIVANELVGPQVLGWLSRELDSDDRLEVFCWVDSVAAVSAMDAALRAAGGTRRIPVLVEVGVPNGRTGVRSHDDGLDVAGAVLAAPTLALAGVSGFEAAALGHAVDEQGLHTVDEFLGRMVRLHRELSDRYEVDEALLSAGGSTYFDRVVKVFGPEQAATQGRPTRVVLRSGAYVAHDDGLYQETTPSVRRAGPDLRPAIHIWARVISIHEPGVAYLDAGKRDLPYDEGLPVAQVARRVQPGADPQVFSVTDHEVFNTNDQHTFVRLPTGSALEVGDVVRLGISHPCTAFDKWSLVPVIDNASADHPAIVDLVRTYF